MENIQDILKRAAQSTKVIQSLSEENKKAVLHNLSDRLKASKEAIIASNVLDLEKMDDADPKKDRLKLTGGRIDDLASSLETIAELPNPSNQTLLERELENGLLITKKTVPLGVVGVIYESRPNVTVDVAALCIRSGNVCLLRGGSDAFHTNTMLVELIHQTLDEFNVDRNIVQLLPVDRRFIDELLTATKYVDIIIPRGSQQLIDFVRNNAKVPVIETGAGVCHTYVESSADLKKAADIVVNAKVSRPSVCNALDTVLIDEKIYKDFIKIIAPKLSDNQVEVYADPNSFEVLSNLQYPFLKLAEKDDFGREFLDLKCSIRVVEDMEQALDHISYYSSKHSEAIVSENIENQVRFLNEVDAAAVYVNASTRFTDGGEFGLGAEIGISTQKLHARGPFALEKLVTEKWLIQGSGQIR